MIGFDVRCWLELTVRTMPDARLLITQLQTFPWLRLNFHCRPIQSRFRMIFTAVPPRTIEISHSVENRQGEAKAPTPIALENTSPGPRK